MTNGNENVYPVVLQHGLANDSWVEVGLTKRELFAAMAMQGMTANPADNCLAKVAGKIVNVTAKYAVEYADDLIAELNKEVQYENKIK